MAKLDPHISFEDNCYSLEFIDEDKRILFWNTDNKCGYAFVLRYNGNIEISRSGNIPEGLFDSIAQYFDNDYDANKMDDALK